MAYEVMHSGQWLVLPSEDEGKSVDEPEFQGNFMSFHINVWMGKNFHSCYDGN